MSVVKCAQLTSRRALGALVALWYAIAIPACSEGDDVPAAPDVADVQSTPEDADGRFAVAPREVDFGDVPVGSVITRTLNLWNESSTTIYVTGWHWTGNAASCEARGLDDTGAIEPGAPGTVEVVCVPAIAGDLAASLVIDSSIGSATVVFTGAAVAGHLVVTPDPIEFGRLLVGDTGTRTVTLSNEGTAPVTVDRMQILAESRDFSASALDELEPFTLEGAGRGTSTYAFDITYSPDSDGSERGTLVVYSDDPVQPEYRVDLAANTDVPCFAMTHDDGYDLGERNVETVHSLPFTITNCSSGRGSRDLVITDIALLEAGGGGVAFALDLDAETWGETGPPLRLSPEASATFRVTYLPTALGFVDTGVLEITSNDPARSPLQVALAGTGGANTCPIAVAACGVDEFVEAPVDTLAANPLDAIFCSGAGSSDRDGDIAGYRWRVDSAPRGFGAEFSGADRSYASVTLAGAGEYVLCLETVDLDGATSCEDACVTVNAVPARGVYVDVMWETPGDTDLTDSGRYDGADVDLHYLHPNGCWEDGVWDTSGAWPEIEWGDRASDDDDPEVGRDDTNGIGPEVVTHERPQDDKAYRIGVEYADDNGFGPSTATVRVFLDGTMVYEGSRELPGTDFFWEVGSVVFPAAEFTSIDQTYAGVPTCR